MGIFFFSSERIRIGGYEDKQRAALISAHEKWNASSALLSFYLHSGFRSDGTISKPRICRRKYQSFIRISS